MKMRDHHLYNLDKKLSILHIVLSIGETNTTYNEHSLPVAEERDITMCTYFKSDITPPRTINLFEGNGSLRGFFRILNAAMNAKEYDIIHVHSPHVGFLFLIFTLFAHRKAISYSVITIHDSYPNYKLRNRLLLIPVFATFQRVICCGQASLDSFPAFYKWLAGARLSVIQNGLDIKRIDRIAENMKQKPIQTSDFTIVAIGRLVDIKNPFSTINAFQRSIDQANKSGHLVYIGDGPLRNSLLRKIRESGNKDHIEFTGLVPREKVFEYLFKADLFISTSKGEGLPVSVLEAMTCRCPVILSDIPPHREIANGVDIIPLVKPDDIEGFAREINKIRELSVSTRAMLGQKCRKLVEERFRLDAMHAEYEKAYCQITAKPVSTFSKEIRDSS
jgi:glycosyltransferase involved in cell wall biosynthesis